MRVRSIFSALLGIVIGLTGAVSQQALAQGEQFFPMLVYRTGPYAPSGIPVANGFRDYYTLINERDGGINGVKISFEECETKYNTKLGVECYEKLKTAGGGATLFNPYSTGITYQLIPKATVDQVPILSMGYGRTAAADGTYFPWVFNLPPLTGARLPHLSITSPRRKVVPVNLKVKRLPMSTIIQPMARKPIRPWKFSPKSLAMN